MIRSDSLLIIYKINFKVNILLFNNIYNCKFLKLNVSTIYKIMLM